MTLLWAVETTLFHSLRMMFNINGPFLCIKKTFFMTLHQWWYDIVPWHHISVEIKLFHDVTSVLMWHYFMILHKYWYDLSHDITSVLRWNFVMILLLCWCDIVPWHFIGVDRTLCYEITPVFIWHCFMTPHQCWHCSNILERFFGEKVRVTWLWCSRMQIWIPTRDLEFLWQRPNFPSGLS